MPKLRRIRLVSVGHDSARFEDVTLDLTDHQERPTNSILWLRNGGGKTSLLSLLFASIRPSKIDFLGKRAEGKIRRIEDYVGPRDQSVVVCEWELDDDGGRLFDDDRPRYLSGFFYQRKSGGDGETTRDIDPAYFATKVSDTEVQLTLDGLPLQVEVSGSNGQPRRRRTLAGFRRRWRQLQHDYPDHDVFIHDRQKEFAKELADRGIDPQVFFYQIRMNEREGGVSERFSFSESEDFVDFLLEMTFDPQQAQQVKEQLSTFRHELLERNEQLKPERELCLALIEQLRKMSQVRNQRVDTAKDVARSKARLDLLQQWVKTQITNNLAEVEEHRSKEAEIRAETREAEEESSAALRRAAVLNEIARSRILATLESEYAAQETKMRAAERLKNIWQAAVPLSRLQNFTKEANHCREQLARLKKELEPDRQQLVTTCTEYANAIDFRREQVSRERETLLQNAKRHKLRAEQLQKEGSESGERAARSETLAAQLSEKIEEAERELKRLRDESVLHDGETVDSASGRITESVKNTRNEVDAKRATIEDFDSDRRQQEVYKQKREHDRVRFDKAHALLKADFTRGLEAKAKLEADDAFLRLLQASSVNVDISATKAISKADDEIPRVHQAILDLEVASVEDKRNIFGLDDTGFLPASRDVQSLLDRLKQTGITCYSGWQYLAVNFPVSSIRERIAEFPHIASGIVVADKDFERVAEISNANAADSGLPCLTAPVAVAPVSTLKDEGLANWRVFGPQSDAYFNPQSADNERKRLSEIVDARNDEIAESKRWYDDLNKLAGRLRDFRQHYPRGWFNEIEQKLNAQQSQIDDCTTDIARATENIETLTIQIQDNEKRLQTALDEVAAYERQLSRCDQYQSQYGLKLGHWREDLDLQRNQTREHRERSQTKLDQSKLARDQAEAVQEEAHAKLLAISKLEEQLLDANYVDSERRAAVAGDIEQLKTDFEQLRAGYEGRLNEQGLLALAERADKAAAAENKELERVLGKFAEISKTDVSEELAKRPAGVSVDEQKENAERAYDDSTRQLGPMKRKVDTACEKQKAAQDELVELEKTGPLPSLSPEGTDDEILVNSERLRKESVEQSRWLEALREELVAIGSTLQNLEHRNESLGKDLTNIRTIADAQATVLERLTAILPDGEPDAQPVLLIKADEDVARMSGEIASTLQEGREKCEHLDRQREDIAKRIHRASSESRFEQIRDSVSVRFKSRHASALEQNADSDIAQIEERIFHIEENLKTAEKQMQIVVDVILGAANEGLDLLGRVSRMSRLPDSLPQAGKRFMEITTKASDNPAERRAKIRDLVDELLEQGEVGEGISLIQKAVRRIGSPIRVRVLHPDLHQSRPRFDIHDLGLFSGGEKLTVAILLYCTLIRLRQQEGYGKSSSSVLVLDNPIGTASRITFLDMQREVAQAMNVQLVYATAVKDLDAVGCLENIIRLRNSRIDRRTGKRMVEVDANGDGETSTQTITTARVSFDSPPSSLPKHEVETGDESLED